MMRTRSLALLATLLLLPAPAWATSVGVDLPRYRHLALRDTSGTLRALGWGGLGVSVLETGWNLGPARLELGLEYTFIRDLHIATNYSFFDARVGLGLPLALTPQFYLVPALEGHSLMTVASPEGLDPVVFGYAPKLSVGYRFTPAATLEVGYALTLVPAWRASSPLSGTLGSLSIAGSYAF